MAGERSESRAAERALESWKAIANYLHRDVRTVQRWERFEGLPVHRHAHNRQATVYAFRDEIDRWLATRDADSHGRRMRKTWQLAAGILLGTLALLGAVYAIFVRPDANPDPGEAFDTPSIVVLPFEYRSEDETLAYFSAGITDDIINLLATLPDLRVTSRTSSVYLSEQGLDLPEIARRLDADVVLEGAVRWEGEQVRVTANLVDAASNTPVRAFRFDRPLDEILEIQSEIATGVVQQLSLSLQDLPEFARRTESLHAERLYLRARYENRKRTAASMYLAIELLDEAIREDPRFGAAYAELAVVHMALPGYSQRPADGLDNRLPPAIQAASRALELDPTLSAPHAVMAAEAGLKMDYIAARAGFERALAISPNDPTTRIWFGMLLGEMGDVDAAHEQFAWAHRVDPLSPMTNRFMGIAMRWSGEHERAVEYLNTAIELGDINARYVRALEFTRAKEFAEAERQLTIWARSHGVDSRWPAVYMAARRDPGHRDEAVAWIRRLELLHRDIGPSTYASIGALDEAFTSARSQIENGTTAFLIEISDPEMKAFRSDPRITELVRDAGLVEYWDRYGWEGYCRRSSDRLTCR